MTYTALFFCGWFLGMSTGSNALLDRYTLMIAIRISFNIFSVAGVLKESAYWLDRFVIK